MSVEYLLAFIPSSSKRTNNLGSEKISDLMFYGMLGAIIGGRFGYMFFYGIEQLSKDPLSIFYVRVFLTLPAHGSSCKTPTLCLTHGMEHHPSR